MRENVDISLVVIGKNDLLTLKRIYAPGYVDRLRAEYVELIYVDSNSDDGSGVFMNSIGFTVYRIASSEMCSAAAGRWVGARESNGQLVQFLDSDMELPCPKQFKFSMLGVLDSAQLKPFECIGVVPVVKDYYPGGGVRSRVRRSRTGDMATSFGGCLLIGRAALASAGGWRYELDSSEDLDLMARLRVLNLAIAYNAETFVIHRTRKSSALDELADYYFPVRQRFGSLGRVLAAQTDMFVSKEIMNIHREVFFAPIVLGLLFLHLGVGIVALVVYETDFLRRRSFKYHAVLPGAVISMAFGLFQTRRKILEPKYALVR